MPMMNPMTYAASFRAEKEAQARGLMLQAETLLATNPQVAAQFMDQARTIAPWLFQPKEEGLSTGAKVAIAGVALFVGYRVAKAIGKSKRRRRRTA